MLRRIDLVPWWTFGIARHFLKREARGACDRRAARHRAAALLFEGRRVLVRSWIEALPLHIARPEPAISDISARRSSALRACTGEGLTHNDLAKEQNWLRTPDGHALLTDFQLATRFSRAACRCSGSRPTRTCATAQAQAPLCARTA